MEDVIKRLKDQYKSFENEFNRIEESEDGILDMGLACSLADAVPYLIGKLEEQQKELEHAKRVNLMAIHIMTDKQNDKLVSLLEKKAK